jgi:hypothetical protein
LIEISCLFSYVNLIIDWDILFVFLCEFNHWLRYPVCFLTLIEISCLFSYVNLIIDWDFLFVFLCEFNHWLRYPVCFQPQVKPINRYAPAPDLTLVYHPTPTLEDLGLTSYLDSPPSSPRAVSPERESQAVLPHQATRKTMTIQQYKSTVTKPDKLEGRPHALSSTKTVSTLRR